MTALARPMGQPGVLWRLIGLAVDLAIGALLTTLPVTALLALGWLTRQMGYTARSRFGAVEESPGWILGPHETGRWSRAFGGLAANMRSGCLTLAALMVWTLPFTLLWLGAWWAGWENSFNKGYEQAFVGPSVFVFGTVLSALLLPVLPVMLAHLASEDRLSAAFELRRLRSVVAQAGWRLALLSVATTVLALPFFAARGLITTAPSFVPGLEDMSVDQIADLRGQIALALAAWAFAALWVLRSAAARLYASAAPCAAGLFPGLWDGAAAAEAAQASRPASRLLATLWYLLAMAAAFGLSTLILMGQFLDHAWWRWTFHPFLTLPWPG